jgi:hypothetical protein
MMYDFARIRSIASGAILTVLLATPASQAALFTYAFTGEVTTVSNPNGFFTNAAAVGAPVAGSFTYTTNPNQGPFSINANFTNYSHIETPADTQLALSIGGAAVHSSEFSLSNMIIGNDNPSDTFPPFFPIGDSFRYLDALDGASTLFDFSQSSQPQSTSGQIFLVDSTGGEFGSQSLPAGLPLSAFDIRFGIVDIYDGNFDGTGRLVFRIDSMGVIPEPSTATMLCFGAMTLATRLRKRC